MICKNCGRELRDGTKICYYCSGIQPNDDDIIDAILSGVREEIEGVDYKIVETDIDPQEPESKTTDIEPYESTAEQQEEKTTILDATIIEEDPAEYSPEAIAARKAAQRARDYRILNVKIVGYLILSVLFFLFICSRYEPIIRKSQIVEAAESIDPASLVTYESGADGKYTYEVLSSDLISTQPGVYNVEYAVTKTNGSGTKNIDYEFTVVDTTAPQINGNDTLEITTGDGFNLADFVSVSDNTGEIDPDQIEVTGNYNTAEDGTYPLTLTVSDASGNTAIKSIALIVKGLSDEQQFFKQIQGTWSNGSSYLSFADNGGAYALSIDSLIYQPSGALNFIYANSNLSAASFSWSWSYSLLGRTLSGTKNVYVDMGTADDGKIFVDLGDGSGYTEYTKVN